MLRSVSARICVTDTQRARVALLEQRLLNTHYIYIYILDLQEIIKIFIFFPDNFFRRNVMKSIEKCT